MKKNNKFKIKISKRIFLILILLAIITTASFAIYKSLFSGNAESNLGDVIIDLKAEKNVETILIDPTSPKYEYKFSVSNFKTENSATKVNQVLCNYYIKVTQLEASIPVDVKLYYVADDGTKTELTLETTGEFKGYYKSAVNLEYSSQKTQNYILEFSKKRNNSRKFNY